MNNHEATKIYERIISSEKYKANHTLKVSFKIQTKDMNKILRMSLRKVDSLSKIEDFVFYVPYGFQISSKKSQRKGQFMYMLDRK